MHPNVFLLNLENVPTERSLKPHANAAHPSSTLHTQAHRCTSIGSTGYNAAAVSTMQTLNIVCCTKLKLVLQCCNHSAVSIGNPAFRILVQHCLCFCFSKQGCFLPDYIQYSNAVIREVQKITEAGASAAETRNAPF